eukprot:4227615-Prymnesium_polylepis.1
MVLRGGFARGPGGSKTCPNTSWGLLHTDTMSASDKPIPRIHHVAAVATPQQHCCVPRAGPAQRP